MASFICHVFGGAKWFGLNELLGRNSIRNLRQSGA